MQPQQTKTLQERDAAIIWHPYTQHLNQPELLPISHGEGVCLVDENGQRYIDAISSWWTNIHGHAHPKIAQAIYEQAARLEHVIFAGCTHEPAVRLAERLKEILPGNFTRFFYSDNGSTAVEVALKMAIQLERNRRGRPRKKILALHNAYHGDTFGAMSVSGKSVFTQAFEDFLFEVVYIDVHTGEEEFTKQLGRLNFEEMAAFIYEPLVQGAGGMAMYDAGKLDRLISLAKKHSVICIADEVMTGFGRTGKLFAGEYLENKADIICLSKGLTGGSLPLSLTACVEPVFGAFLSHDPSRTFFHGHSYTANPVACAAGLASLDLLLDPQCMESISRISVAHTSFIEKIKTDHRVLRPRSLGTILAFELSIPQNDYLSTLKNEVIRLSLGKGVFLRPLGNTIYLMPPYSITLEELDKVYELLLEVIAL